MPDKETAYAIGLFLTFLLGVWNLCANYSSSKKTNFINTVTSQRIIWIEQLRQDIASFLGLTHTWCMSEIEGTSEENEILKELDRLRHVIRLRLNSDATHDRKIADLIKKIPDLTQPSQKEDRVKAMEELIDVSQKLLKEEWEKVKKESKNGDLNPK
jgi:hypothetical protein